LRLAGVACAVLTLWPAMATPQGIDRGRTDRLMAALVAAYPDFLSRYEGNDIVWKDSTRMAFDDGRGVKDFEAMLEAPDLEDMFYAPYPLGRSGTAPGVNIDPGRVRYQPMFAKMYGDCTKGEVARHLVDVVWLPSKGGQKLKATRINGVAARLQAVSDELDRLPAEFSKYLKPSAGTYNCRVVAGTHRISAHGHGIAIDIATTQADYWRWTRPGPDGRYVYRNRIPWEIVEVFEKHGFVWGGKWYHFDTMHFEYRPEIVAASQ
jgi:D-alanyl-D-alanine carboxypeptidase